VCGIVGVYAPEGAPDLRPALRRLVHRGPDDEGHWEDETVRLGVRRLAIIDLERGRQPLSNENGRVVAVQNGEIYNYIELMRELETRGHRFRTRCDTEVLVHAWEEWGPACVQYFRGMFAIAIYDRSEKSLFLARDRFGIKPLYLHRQGERLTFASELPALLTLLPEQPRLNPRPLAHLLSFGWIPGPETLYANVHHLPPGHSLLITPSGERRTHYWRPLPASRNDLVRPKDAAEQLIALLQESVTMRLRSDVPVGALLSGGVDSSLVAALMRRSAHPDLHTFNIGFDDPAYDETPFAELAASHLHVTHHTVRFDKNAFDLLPRLVADYGQPVGSATHIAIWLLYRACAEAGLKVILTGEGADELFGGYQWYLGEAKLAKARRWPRWVRRIVARMGPRWGASAAASDLLRRPDAPLAVRYLRWLTPHSPRETRQILHPDLREQADASAPWPHLPPDIHLLHALTLLDAQSRLPDFINLEVDRMSMAHSVEARTPFLDHKLWEVALRWDPRLNLAGGREKALLRAAAAPFLPKAIVQRRKKGLASPHATWWRQTRLPEWAETAMSRRALEQTGLFHHPAVTHLRETHRAGLANHATALTAILTTQLLLNSSSHKNEPTV